MGYTGGRASTTARGYGAAHQMSRKAAFAALPEWSPCCRCGRRMWKFAVTKPDRHGRAVSALHWDHNWGRTGYIGFSCAACNCKAGGQLSARRQAVVGSRRSRLW